MTSSHPSEARDDLLLTLSSVDDPALSSPGWACHGPDRPGPAWNRRKKPRLKQELPCLALPFTSCAGRQNILPCPATAGRSMARRPEDN